MINFRKVLMLLCFFSTLASFSQNKDFNFIVSVNKNLNDVYADKFVITNKTGTLKSIPLNYVQGKLSVSDNAWKELISEDVSKIDLLIRRFKKCGENIENINYEVEDFKLAWLTKGSFYTLFIYDTTSKYYKKLYEPLPNKNFTFEFDWSEGSMRRTQKKLTKQQRKCRS